MLNDKQADYTVIKHQGPTQNDDVHHTMTLKNSTDSLTSPPTTTNTSSNLSTKITTTKAKTINITTITTKMQKISTTSVTTTVQRVNVTRIKFRKKTKLIKNTRPTNASTLTSRITTTTTSTKTNVSTLTVTKAFEDIKSSKMELIVNTNSTSSLKASGSNGSAQAPTRYSILTLTVVLSCIYGLALVFGIVWILWLYVRRKTMFSLKNSQFDFNRDFYSTNSMN